MLDIPTNLTAPIRLLHPSFRDFLLSKDRDQAHDFWIDGRKGHRFLAERCLEIKSQTLKADICNLQMPGTLASQVEWAKVEKYLSAEVRYACYWVGHARQSEVDLCEDGGPVHHFLQKHLLHWLEALSLMKKVNEAMEVVETLNDMVMVCIVIRP